MSKIDDVYAAIVDNPGSTELEIAAIVWGQGAPQQKVNPLCRKLYEEGRVQKSGCRPATYSFTGRPASNAASSPSRVGSSSGCNAESDSQASKKWWESCTLDEAKAKLGPKPLFIIPCCKKKAPGGTNHQGHIFTNTGAHNFLRARQQAESIHGGRIIGPYMEAHQRYQGRLYSVPGVSALLQGRRDDVMIMSALFGLLDTHDSIRVYDLRMTTRGLVPLWGAALPQVMHDVAAKRKATSIVGLLQQAGYGTVFDRLQNLGNTPVPAFRISTTGRGATRLNRGLAHALLHLQGKTPIPPGFHYSVRRLV